MKKLLMASFFLLLASFALATDVQPIEWKNVFEATATTDANYFKTEWNDVNTFGIDPYFDDGWVLTTSPTSATSGDTWGSVGTAIKGKGKVQVTEYCDFESPFCAQVYPTIEKIKQDYANKIVFTYKQFPISQIHPLAQKAAEASECAREQGKFEEYYDLLYTNQSTWVGTDGNTKFREYATNLGLNSTQFNDCLDQNKMAPKVNADYQEGLSKGITGTPTVFINDSNVIGTQPYETFKQKIDAELAKSDFSTSNYVRLGFTLKPLGDDQQNIPTIRLRLNRLGGEHQWKISEALFVFPRNMKNSWNQGEERTFYMIVNLQDYPINQEGNLSILAAVDLIVPSGSTGQSMTGGVKLTGFSVERDSGEIGVIQSVFQDNLRNQSIAENKWKTIPQFGSLPALPINYSAENQGFTFKIKDRFIEPATATNIQASGLVRNDQVNLSQDQYINRYSLQFFKSFEEMTGGCRYVPTIRLRVSTHDWAFAQERYYFFMNNSFPLDYPAVNGSKPMELTFSPSNATPFTSNKDFRFAVDALNYSKDNCAGSSFTVNQATLTTLANVSQSSGNVSEPMVE